MATQIKNVCPVCRNVNELTAAQCRYCGNVLIPPQLPAPPVARLRRWWPLAATGAVSVVLLAIAGFLLFGLGGPAASSETTPPSAVAGDPARGQAVFNRGCNTCHNTNQVTKVGPGLAGLFAPGGPTLPSGIDYGGNLSNGKPITVENVKAWIRSGGQGKIGTMPPSGNIPNLTDADLDDLVAYLRTLQK